MIVETTSGPIEGTKADDLLRFAGIPYAAAPVGDLRFRAPQPHPGWSEVRSAAEFGPIARQNASPLEALLARQDQTQSEDCLSLNVWTPGADDRRRPTMVWIHGGAFVMGSGSTPIYDGSALASRGDVVVVSINYRLGDFGFLYLDHLDADYSGSGNNGIRDQIAALEWVRDNIASFGGDPENVTIFGESAGAMSVSTLLGTPKAAGLFGRAIPQSGAAAHTISREQAMAVTDAYLAQLGVSTVDQLLGVSDDDLLANQAAISATYLNPATRPELFPEGMLWQPVIDGDVLPSSPLAAVDDGAAAGIDLLVGTNADEWHLFEIMAPDSPAEEQLLGLFGRVLDTDDPAGALAEYRATHPNADAKQIRSALLTDQTFRIPAHQLLDAQQRHHGAVWSYLFTWATPAFDGALGSCHALEIPFVFGTQADPQMAAFLGDAPPATLAELMMDAWIAFARSGDPNHAGLPQWPPFTPDTRPSLEFGDTVQLLNDPDGATRKLWMDESG